MNVALAKNYLIDTTRSIPDYPSPGIIFRDLSTVFQDKKAMVLALDLFGENLSDPVKGKIHFDKFAGIEARGFILAGALAARLGGGMVMIRKPGKLPYKTISKSYELEYGKDALEIHIDSVQPGERIVVVDDLLATGGTAEAACKLVEELGGVVVKVLFLVELPELKGRKRLEQYEVSSIISFEGE